MVVRRMARDLDIPTEIVGSPTVRDGHGLALSSRNAYLSRPELAIARRLNGVLAEAGARATARRPLAAVERGPTSLLKAGFEADRLCRDPPRRRSVPVQPAAWTALPAFWPRPGWAGRG